MPEGASQRLVTIRRADRPGDLGWMVMAHGELYDRQFGWNTDIEALVAQIVVNETFRGSGGSLDRSVLLVAPSARGLGLGARLVKESLAFAPTAAYRRVTLWTTGNRASARRIYLHFGFVLTHEKSPRAFDHDLIGQTWSLDLLEGAAE